MTSPTPAGSWDPPLSTKHPSKYLLPGGAGAYVWPESNGSFTVYPHASAFSHLPTCSSFSTLLEAQLYVEENCTAQALVEAAILRML